MLKKADLRNANAEDLAKQAQNDKMTLANWLTHQAREGKVEEGLYSKDVEDTKGKTPIQQMMRNVGILTKSNAQTMNDAFFANEGGLVFFPVYVEAKVREFERTGSNMLDLEDIVASEEPVSGGAVAYGIIEEIEGDGPGSRTTQGGQGGQVSVTNSEEGITLTEDTWILKVSYSAILEARFSTLDRYLAKVGRKRARQRLKRALAILANGDRNGRPSPNTNIASTEWTLTDLIALQMALQDVDADPRILVGDATEMLKILSLSHIKDSNSTSMAAAFRDTGNWPAILGMQPKRAPVGSVLDGSKKLMAVDTLLSLTRYYNPAYDMVETQNLIKTGFKEMVFREKETFSKPDVAASRTLTRQ